MALQYVGGASVVGTTTALTVPLTSLTGGIGTAAQAGDFVIVATGCPSTINRDVGVTTAGYTELADLYVNATSRDANFAVAVKRLDTAETSVSCLPSGSGGNAAVAVVQVWRGTDPATQLDVASTTATGAESGSVNGPAITPVTPGAVVVTAWLATTNDAMPSVTAPAGYENAVVVTHDPTIAASAGLAGKVWSGSGAEDPAPWGNTSIGAGESWGALTLALRPAASSASTVERSGSVAGGSAVSATRRITRPRGASVAAASTVAAGAKATRPRTAATASVSAASAASAISRGRSGAVAATSSATAAYSTSGTASASVASVSAVSASPSVLRSRVASITASSALSADYTTGSTTTASAAIAAASQASATPKVTHRRGGVVTATSIVTALPTTASGQGGSASVTAASSVTAQAARIIRRASVIAAGATASASRSVTVMRPAEVVAASAVTAQATSGFIVQRFAYPGETRGGFILSDPRGGTLIHTARSGIIQRG